VRIGLYGGSFDPIHRGHLAPVRRAREVLGLDRVLYLPTARPPHKPERDFASRWARYAMVELALLEEDGLYASPFEIRRSEPSYTVDTLEHFRRRHPGAELVYLLGADSFAQLDGWREWRRIVELAELGVLTRPGWQEAASPAELPAELRRALGEGRARRVENEPVDASSTEIRRRLAAGGAAERELAGLVPPRVLHYIAKYDLYRGGRVDFEDEGQPENH